MALIANPEVNQSEISVQYWAKQYTKTNIPTNQVFYFLSVYKNGFPLEHRFHITSTREVGICIAAHLIGGPESIQRTNSPNENFDLEDYDGYGNFTLRALTEAEEQEVLDMLSGE